MDDETLNVVDDQMMDDLLHDQIKQDMLSMDLAGRTKQYWRFYRSWRGFPKKGDEPLTMGLLLISLRCLSDVAWLRMENKLIVSVETLMQEVIVGKIPKALPRTGNVIKLHSQIVQYQRRSKEQKLAIFKTLYGVREV